jgi:hypothetical protein
MSDPNIIGHVVEFCSDRDIITTKDGSGNVFATVPGPVKCRLRLSLRNTLGQTKSIWVEASSDLEGFFSPEGDTTCR